MKKTKDINTTEKKLLYKACENIGMQLGELYKCNIVMSKYPEVTIKSSSTNESSKIVLVLEYSVL